MHLDTSYYLDERILPQLGKPPLFPRKKNTSFTFLPPLAHPFPSTTPYKKGVKPLKRQESFFGALSSLEFTTPDVQAIKHAILSPLPLKSVNAERENTRALCKMFDSMLRPTPTDAIAAMDQKLPEDLIYRLLKKVSITSEVLLAMILRELPMDILETFLDDAQVCGNHIIEAFRHNTSAVAISKMIHLLPPGERVPISEKDLICVLSCDEEPLDQDSLQTLVENAEDLFSMEVFKTALESEMGTAVLKSILEKTYLFEFNQKMFHLALRYDIAEELQFMIVDRIPYDADVFAQITYSAMTLRASTKVVQSLNTKAGNGLTVLDVG